MKSLILCLALSGCATIPGVAITEDERKACEVQTCTVWTIDELTGLARKFFREGYRAGVRSI